MRIIHIGLCVQPKPYNGFQTAFIDVIGEENYREISTAEPDLNNKIISLCREFNPDLIRLTQPPHSAIRDHRDGTLIPVILKV